MVWVTPLLMTMQLMAVSVLIAAVIGILGAWAGFRLQSGGRVANLFSRIFFTSMVAAAATPMILHATAWEATAGKFGWMMLTQTGARTDSTGSYGFFVGLAASAWIHGVVGSAFVTIATWWGVGRVSPVLVAQSRLEMGPNAAFWRVLIPLASPWWIASLVGTALLAATEMTVVDLYGYRTVADQFYLFYAMDPSPMAVATTCVFPLAICAAGIGWLLVSRPVRRVGRSRTIERFGDGDAGDRHGIWLAWGLAMSVAVLVIGVPMFGLLTKAGQDVAVENGAVVLTWSPWQMASRLAKTPLNFGSEYQWTSILAAMVATASLVVAWPIAALGRQRPRFQSLADAFSIFLVCIPGPIVGLVVVHVFQTDVVGFKTLYQQTLVPTTIALMVRGVPVAYWIVRSGYRGIDDTVLQSAAMDLSPWRRGWLIDRPLLMRSAIAAWLAVVVTSSGDVPASLPVIPAGVSTVGIRLFGLLHSGARYQEACLALGYIAAVVGLTVVCLGRRSDRRVRV
ncbi:hypothetical protein K227x_29180 [Rubripirellula lacrimiformis]|uniref:ABC transmembrane type-1 domain-containing protein n=1 Tax=Rubripirellula lacrimiformis TaxID=1930273 RepID=A0A517NBK6_9BACT|nr:iron ABC transporter permease [Rubripirellula lacrimiformis]QDT04526.1 hypothetical protein K227x_29180 [Rubripirellula lacrimiformis]